IGGAAILTAVPLSLQWSQKNGCYRLPARSPRTGANCDEHCRCQPNGISPRIPQRGLRKGCWLRLWIVLQLWMSGVFLTGYLTEQAPLHLTASTAAATP